MLTLLKQHAEFRCPEHPKWKMRPQEMVRSAACSAVVRAVGKRADFAMQYTKQRRIPVVANEIVGWVWHEKLQHSVDFHVVFVEPTMNVGEEVEVLQMRRRRNHSGSVVAAKDGEVRDGHGLFDCFVPLMLAAGADCADVQQRVLMAEQQIDQLAHHRLASAAGGRGWTARNLSVAAFQSCPAKKSAPLTPVSL